MDNVGLLPGLGTTYLQGKAVPSAYTAPVHLLGIAKYFIDTDPAAGVGAKIPLTGYQSMYRLVQNDSGGTLAAGKVVSWKAASFFKEVDGLTGTANEGAAGVVDPFLDAAVRDLDIFWLCVWGPCEVQVDATGVTEGDIVMADGSGEATTVGTPGSDTDAMNFAVHKLGIAMETGGAATSARIFVTRY